MRKAIKKIKELSKEEAEKELLNRIKDNIKIRAELKRGLSSKNIHTLNINKGVIRYLKSRLNRKK